jgi:hypothetical protein
MIKKTIIALSDLGKGLRQNSITGLITVFLSQNAGNRLAYGTDNGVFVSSELPPRENQGGRFLMTQSDGDLAWAIPSTNSDGGNARSIYLPSQVSDGGTAHG